MTARSPASEAAAAFGVVACRLCGVLQRVAAVPPGSAIECSACGERLRWHRPFTRSRSAWLACGALILLLPAALFPMVSAHFLGNYNQFTLLQVIGRLWQSNHCLIAAFIASITLLAPALQSGALCLLGVLGPASPPRLRLGLQRLVQMAEPWNMSQMFLLALLVGVVQFGRVSAVQVEPGALAFALMVTMSRAAAIEFEPAEYWEERDLGR